MSDIPVLFSGAQGRMGRALCPRLASTEGISLVGEVDRDDDLASAIRVSGAQVVVDFTTPASAMTNARTILAAGAQGVIGTTGFRPEDLEALDGEARAAGRGLLIAPNFSLGVILLQRFAELAVRHFPRVEILETHHEGKHDAPSGTALHTARRLAAIGVEAGPGPDDPSRGRDVDGVRVHALRLRGIDARQEVHFAAEHEALVLRHDAFSRECYLDGVALGIRSMPGHVGLIRSLDELLFPADAS